MPDEKILLVEGNDDEHVVRHICAKRGVGHLLGKICPQGSVEALLESMPVQLKAYDKEGDAVGVLIDANSHPEKRWKAIRKHLIEVGYQNAPRTPDPLGTILLPLNEQPLPRVGIWVMPDNKSSGNLEDFLFPLIPKSDILYSHVVKSVSTTPRSSKRRFKDKDETKALLRTWLAWQKQPGKPYGLAIAMRYLKHRGPHVDAFISWLQRLFA